MKSADQENRIDAILSAEKDRRPGWLRFAKRKAPSWFSGHEFDLLDQDKPVQIGRREINIAITNLTAPIRLAEHFPLY
ncbi:MAG: hypothetical protein JOY60_11335 [Burkholderiaceae bacterium]|nr:hypothetical protein [Roseateles sp.]MBV8470435.1 hypothetical protein [Burkholderiaceae bacterium]